MERRERYESLEEKAEAMSRRARANVADFSQGRLRQFIGQLDAEAEAASFPPNPGGETPSAMRL